MSLPDDHSGVIAAFHKVLRFFRTVAWVGVFVALVLFLSLTKIGSAR